MKLEDLTIKEVCSCLAILNQLQEEGIVNIDLKTTRATINVDKTTEYLENQNVELQQRIDKAIEYIESEYTIIDDDVCLALYSSDGTLDKLEEILKGED